MFKFGFRLHLPLESVLYEEAHNIGRMNYIGRAHYFGKVLNLRQRHDLGRAHYLGWVHYLGQVYYLDVAIILDVGIILDEPIILDGCIILDRCIILMCPISWIGTLSGIGASPLWRCPWCNGYRRRIWARRHKLKSWTWLIAFHIALIPLGKVWIQIFSLQLRVNSRAD